MRMFHLDAMWKNRLPDVRKDLRDRYLRAHATSFFTFVEQAFVDAQHRRGMLRSALGYCRNQKDALIPKGSYAASPPGAQPGSSSAAIGTASRAATSSR